MSLVGALLERADIFLAPVLKKANFIPATDRSVVDKICDALEKPPNYTRREFVVQQATSLLVEIHEAVLSDDKLSFQILNDLTSRRTVDALLDLISLEGIYPKLLPGVGVPLERRISSILQGGVSITNASDEEVVHDGLEIIADSLYDIVISGRGIAPAIHYRTLIDIIAAVCQLAFAPHAISENPWATTKFSTLLNSLTPAILFPALVPLEHTNTPAWMKSHIKTPVALLPLRAGGVRQAITFMAKAMLQDSAQNIGSTKAADKGPVLPLEIIQRISKTLTTRPSIMSFDQWFEGIAQQLIDLLQDNDPDARRAAAYTISHGILAKKSLGAPGTTGWNLFAQPMIDTICSTEPLSQRDDAILTALAGLSAIVLLFAYPGNSLRLLKPIVLPLWSIACHSKQESPQYDLAIKLLGHYINSISGSQGLEHIFANIQYPAGKRIGSFLNMDSITARCNIFTTLIDTLNDSKELSLFFAVIVQEAFGKSAGTNTNIPDTRNPTTTLIAINLAQYMISTKTVELAKDYRAILIVVEGTLRAQLSLIEASHALRTDKVTFSDLAGIADVNATRNDSIQELEDSLDFCLPLLALLLQNQTSKSDQETLTHCDSLRTLLEAIELLRGLPAATKQLVQTIVDQLGTLGKRGTNATISADAQYEIDLEILTAATKNLQVTEAPPIRVEGLTQLESLLARGATVVSVPSVTATILPLLQDSDSFVYLSVIKTLVSLARRNNRATLKTIMEIYEDVTEQSTIDVRLRLGEALQTIIEETGSSLTFSSVDYLISTLVHIAGRRIYRPQIDIAQKKAAIIAQHLSTPQGHDRESEDDMVEQENKPQQDLQSILDLWQGKNGVEDLRVRASALTILGTCFEHASLCTTARYLSASFELISQILIREKGTVNAILRRAAVLVVLAIVKGQNNDKNNSIDLMASGLDSSGIALDGLVDLLEEAAVGDEDDLVRGHAENVIDAIKSWREEKFATLLRGDDVRFGLQQNMRLRGLDIDPGAPQVLSGRRKVEEVE